MLTVDSNDFSEQLSQIPEGAKTSRFRIFGSARGRRLAAQLHGLAAAFLVLMAGASALAGIAPIYVADEDAPGIFVVNPQTRAATPVVITTPPANPTDLDMLNPSGAPNLIAVSDCPNSSVWVVDVMTGGSQLLQQGGGIICPAGLDAESGDIYVADRGTIVIVSFTPLVVDVTAGKIVKFDTAMGVSSLVYEDPSEMYALFTDVAYEDANHLLFTNARNLNGQGGVNEHPPSLNRLDLTTGLVTSLVTFANELFPSSISIDAAGQIYVALDQINYFANTTTFFKVVKVDPVTAAETVVWDLNSGPPQPLDFLGGIAIDDDGDLIVADLAPNSMNPGIYELSTSGPANPQPIITGSPFVGPSGVTVPEPSLGVGMLVGVLAMVIVLGRLRSSSRGFSPDSVPMPGFR